jgi:hypothetical protein
MASKKGVLKAIGLISLGFLVGAIVAGGLFLWSGAVTVGNFFYSEMFDATNTAFMIRTGHEKDVVENIESYLRQSVPFIVRMPVNKKKRLGTLWYVQRYYERFDINVPAEIQPILNNLPPRPSTSCEINKLRDANTEPNNIETKK